MISFWALVAALPTYLLVSSIISFLTNLRNAKKTGLPIVISPIDHLNPLWVAFQKPLGPLLAKLPFGLGNWIRYNKLSWFFDDKYRMHEEHGKVFLHVTPGMNELHSIDPETNAQIFARRKDFEKPEKILKSVTIYGDSITSVTGPDWQRHRRITAPPFNERNCRLVWDESLTQSGQLAKYWSARSDGISPIVRDIASMALNVLATSALGRSWRFCGTEEGEGAEEDPEAVLCRNSLAYLLKSIRFLVLTPLWVYSMPPAVLPGKLSKYVSAHREFRRYMEKMVKEKKAEVATGEISDDTFLNTIVSKSEEFRKLGKPSTIEGASVSGGLYDEEIYGNLFTFNFAGHETTAGTLTYALHLLAVYQQMQDWVREEVLCVYDQCTGPSGTTPSYEAAFPLLKRCLAVMYETLRMYNPVNSVNKATVGHSGQELVIDGRSVRIPPNTMTAPNVIGSATFPEFWGQEHLDWKPDRWIEAPRPSQELNLRDSLSQENVVQPAKSKGAFIPWSGGARVCPGKKVSQVEFVAVVATLLRAYRIEVVPRQGETEAQARARCLEVVKDSETQVTLQMRDPESVSLRLIRL